VQDQPNELLFMGPHVPPLHKWRVFKMRRRDQIPIEALRLAHICGCHVEVGAHKCPLCDKGERVIVAPPPNLDVAEAWAIELHAAIGKYIADSKRLCKKATPDALLDIQVQASDLVDEIKEVAR